MVGAQRLVTVTLAWLLTSAKSPGVDGYSPSSLANANVDVTEETPDSSGPVNTSDIIHSQDSEQFENGTTFGCPCDLNQCDRFCCPRGHSYNFGANDCTVDRLTPRVHGFEGSIENYTVTSHVIHLWNGHPGYKCWDTPIPHSRNGGICRTNLLEYPDLMDYCLYRVLNKRNYEILQCIQLPDPKEIENVDYRGNEDIFERWSIACFGTASLVALATFIVLSLVPELKTFQGWIVRSYLASYFSCMMFMTSLFFPRGFSGIVRLVTVPFLIYFGVACLLWLNVMSLDIWRTFRKFRPNQAVNDRDRHRTTFIRYSLHAWGIPVLPASIAAIGWASNKFAWEIMIVLVSALFGICVCNTYFFVLTALTIRKCNKETARMVDSASTHHRKNKQWFNLYLKLFLIMGCPIILWAVLIVWHNKTYVLVVFSMEPLQALCVFYMFVWKDDVKRSIREQFSVMLRRLGWCRRRDSTSDSQNGIEEL